jgi:predicted nuclease with RNAse H fold
VRATPTFQMNARNARGSERENGKAVMRAGPWTRRKRRSRIGRNLQKVRCWMNAQAIRTTVVAGIDVGGPRKGFHVVALRDGRYLDHFASRDAAEVVAWCRNTDVSVVGVDAPCQWRRDGKPRAAERALAAVGFSCFATPTRLDAVSHPTGYYDWMLNGERLFAHLREHFAPFDGHALSRTSKVYFETFPHAIACTLAGHKLPARRKATSRRAVLRDAGIDAARLRNVDEVDAALCASAAHHVARGRWVAYGEPADGPIVLPESQGLG